jgi:hypothetical protein
LNCARTYSNFASRFKNALVAKLILSILLFEENQDLASKFKNALVAKLILSVLVFEENQDSLAHGLT